MNKGTQRNQTKIDSLIALFENTNSFQTWSYMGLEVEIDPTIDYNNENALIRWTSIDEGFNGKIIVSSLIEFYSLFKPVSQC